MWGNQILTNTLRLISNRGGKTWCNSNNNKNYFTDHASQTDKPHRVLFTRPKSSPHKSPRLYCVLRHWEIQVMENRTLSRNWGSETKSPTQTTTQLAHWQTGTRRLSSSPFHSIGVPPSTAREYPFPSGQPRGKEAGNVAVFGALLSVCVCVSICLLVINGGSSNICSFSCWRMTHSQSFLALIRHNRWPPSFLAECWMWLRNSFRHFNTSKYRLLYS